MTASDIFDPAPVDAALEAAVGARLAGAVVRICVDGAEIYARAAGFADREAGRAMAMNDIFLFASVSKPIVSLAALRLVDEGVLALDAPVTDWLPQFRPALPDGRRPAIAIWNLLSHTAGLGYRFLEDLDGPYHRLGISTGFDGIEDTLDGVVARLAQAPLLYPPGEGWSYSMATDVLGAVVAAAAGSTLPAAVRDLVTGPLGLEADFASPDPARRVVHYADGEPRPVRMAGRHVVPYFGTPVEFDPDRLDRPGAWPSAGAGMAGTAGDALKALETLRTGGSLIRPDTLAKAHDLHSLPAEGVSGPGWGFGLASAVLDDPAAAGAPHSAGTLAWGGAFGHSWFIDPDRALTVVALTNTAFEGMSGRFPIELRDAVYAALGA